MIKIGIIKVKSIENEEMIMAMTKIIIATVIIKIMIIIRTIMTVKIGKHIKIEKCYNGIKSAQLKAIHMCLKGNNVQKAMLNEKTQIIKQNLL